MVGGPVERDAAVTKLLGGRASVSNPLKVARARSTTVYASSAIWPSHAEAARISALTRAFKQKREKAGFECHPACRTTKMLALEPIILASFRKIELALCGFLFGSEAIVFMFLFLLTDK
jgi:hypothetical protein